MKRTFITILILLTSIPLLAQSKFELGANAGASIPIGEFTKFYQTGYGGNAQFIYNVSNNFLLVLTVAYDRWTVDEEAVNTNAENKGLNRKFDINSSFRVIPILIGARYYFSKGKSRAFLSVDFGGYLYKFRLEGIVINTIPGADIPHFPIPEQVTTGTESTLSLGLGYIVRLSKHWYVEFNSKYNVMTNAFTINNPDEIYDPEDPTTIYGIKGTLNFITIMAGIDYRF